MVRMIMELVENRSFTLTAGDGKQSKLRRLKNNVPQGSVLASLLFNILSALRISRKFAYDAAALFWKLEGLGGNFKLKHDYANMLL